MKILDRINPLPLVCMTVGLVATAVLVFTKHIDAAIFVQVLNLVLQSVQPQIHKASEKTDDSQATGPSDS